MKFSFNITAQQAFIIALCLSSSLYAADRQDKDVLLDGLLARDSLIRTGTFVYKFDSLLLPDYGNGPPWPWTKEDEPYTSELTIAGDEWVVRWPNSPIVSVRRSNFSATYTETPQPEGEETYRSLIITDQAGVHTSLEQECKTGNPRFCFLRSARMPTSQIAEFIDANRHRIEYKGEVAVNGIASQLLQITVSKKDIMEMMSSYHPIYFSQESIIISFYIAPKLTYAAVRIDFSTPEGFMVERYEALDFVEVAPGIFFPKVFCNISNFTSSGRGYYVYQYLFSEINNVNKRIPDSAFKISVPEGARVRDSRPGSGDTVFYVDKGVTFSSADELIKKTIAPTKHGYTRIVLCILGASLLLLGLGLKFREHFAQGT